MRRSMIPAAIAWVGCLLALVGALGPWAKAFAITVSGLDGSNDGWIVLVLALIAAGLVLGGLFAHRGWAAFVMCFLAVAAAGGILVTAFHDRSNLTDNIASHNAEGVVSVGWGLNVVIVAGFIIAIGSFFVSVLHDPREPRSIGSSPPPAQAVAPPGWYADPRGQASLRYWDGNSWTESTSA